MKNILKYCAVAAFVISAVNSALAADTAELKVQGTLIMGSCTPSLPSDGVVDYGSLPVDSLSGTAVNQLGVKEVTLTVTCTSPTKVSWTVVDDRSDSVIDTKPDTEGSSPPVEDEFGLGTTDGGIKLGSYSIIAQGSKVIVDGVAGILADSVDNGTTWAVDAQTVYHRADGTRYFTFTDAQANPVAVTNASDVLKIGASVQDTTTLAMTDDTSLDGQATISVKYL